MPLQEWIHKLEVGPWIRYVKIGTAVLAVVLLVVGFNWRSYRNMNSLEAMDAAQVARNLSEGRGFTTLFIRPFSIYLVKKHNQAKADAAKQEVGNDPAQIKGMHPDLANAPVYPVVLAGWMKTYPPLLKAADGIREILPDFVKDRLPHFDLTPENRLWTSNGKFWWHSHDCLIALLNEIIFFIVIWLTFLLARRLFDSGVAWLSALLLFGCEYLWHFSVSGLSTMLLLLILTGLVWCLVFFESEAREPKSGGPSRLLLLAATAGLLTGIGGLTRYSFGWLLVPVLVFIGLFGGQRRLVACASAAVIFAVVLSPWIYRNVSVSGTPFGTAGYAFIENTPAFSENRLGRSLEPNLEADYVKITFRKLMTNSRQVLTNDLPKLAGGWVTPFFIVGLLLGLRNPAIRRLRYFVMMSLLVLIVVQALGRTQLSEDSADFNSENLLVLLLPLILVYSVSLLFILLDQINLPFPQLRYVVMGAFAAIVCMPLIYSFLPPRSSPIAYPPYYPPLIQESSGWMKENELMMSDVPWAVAWYGKRQCVWLTLNVQDDFFAVNDYLKPVRGLYLTPLTVDGRFVSQWVRAGDKGWGFLLIDTILRQQIPSTFPLRKSPKGYLPDQLFLTDRERWKGTADAADAAESK